MHLAVGGGGVKFVPSSIQTSVKFHDCEAITTIFEGTYDAQTWPKLLHR